MLAIWLDCSLVSDPASGVDPASAELASVDPASTALGAAGGAAGGLGGEDFPLAAGVMESSPQPARTKLTNTSTQATINRDMGPPREKTLPRRKRRLLSLWQVPQKLSSNAGLPSVGNLNSNSPGRSRTSRFRGRLETHDRLNIALHASHRSRGVFKEIRTVSGHRRSARADQDVTRG